MLLPVYLVVGLINIFAKSNNYNIPNNTNMDIRVKRSAEIPLSLGTGKNNVIRRVKRNFEWKNIFSGSRSVETASRNYELIYKGTLNNGIEKEMYTDITKQNNNGLNSTYTIYRNNNLYNQYNRFNATHYNGNGYNAVTQAPVFYNYQNPNGANFGGYFGQNRTINGFNTTSHNINKTNGNLSAYNQQLYYPTSSPTQDTRTYKSFINNSDNLLNKLLNNSYQTPSVSPNTGINPVVNTNNGFQSYFYNNNGKTQFGTSGPNFNSEFTSNSNGFQSTFSNTGYPYTQYQNNFTNYGYNGNSNFYSSQGYYNQNNGYNPYPQNNGTQNRFKVSPNINYNSYPAKGNDNKSPNTVKNNVNNTGIDNGIIPVNSTVLGCVICNIPCPAFMKRFRGICIDEDY